MPRGVYKHKPHAGMFKKGNVPFTKGRSLSEEHKAKISESHIGLGHTEETKLKMSQAQKLRFQNNPAWNKGKKMSQEAVEKNRLAQTGKKPTLETRQKIRAALLGEKNHNYIDGRTKLGSRHTQDLHLKLWRVGVFERDNYTCQGCGQRGGYLEAHHIKSWAEYVELRYVLENGQTLCKKCHKLTDNYAGRKGKN